MSESIRKDLEQFLDYGGLYRGAGYGPHVFSYRDAKKFFKLLTRAPSGGVAIARIDAQVELLQRLEAAGLFKSPGEHKDKTPLA